MHEVRRPLQAIALSLEKASPTSSATGACLEQARAALRELDAIVNGAPRRSRPVSRALVGEVLDGLAGRWRFADVEVEPRLRRRRDRRRPDPPRRRARQPRRQRAPPRHRRRQGPGRHDGARRPVRGPRRRSRHRRRAPRSATRPPPRSRPQGRRRRRREPRRQRRRGGAVARRRDDRGDLAAGLGRAGPRMSRRSRALAFGLLAVVCGVASASIASAYRDRVDEQLGETQPVVTLDPAARGGDRPCAAPVLRKATRDAGGARPLPAAGRASPRPTQATGRRLAVAVPAGSYLLGSQLRMPGRARSRPAARRSPSSGRGDRERRRRACGRRCRGAASTSSSPVSPSPAAGPGSRSPPAASGCSRSLRPTRPTRRRPARDGWSATLALTRAQALDLIEAENFAREIRLIPVS